MQDILDETVTNAVTVEIKLLVVLLGEHALGDALITGVGKTVENVCLI